MTNSEDEKYLPGPVERDLNIISDKHTEFDKTNIVIISNYKNKRIEYRENDVVLPLYHPSIGTTSFTLDAHMYYLYEYLNIINALREQNKGNIILI